MSRSEILAASILLGVGTVTFACGRGRRASGERELSTLRAPVRAPVVKLDHFGYRPADSKLAVVTVDPGPAVDVRSSTGALVISVPKDGGSIRNMGFDATSGDRVWWVDFSALRTAGAYRLESPTSRARSYDFLVAPDVYDAVLRTALRTFYLQRCGVAKPIRHAGAWADEGPCHRADTAAGPAEGQRDLGARDLSGGWHDAGDYNKYVSPAPANAILFLLRAWEREPRAFPDEALGIPESGNGVSDLLDEVKWELDFLLRMQLADGSVLSQLHAPGSANGAVPPSADKTLRGYRNPSLESGAVFAGICALASRAFAAAGQRTYAATLGSAARRAWRWLQTQGDSAEKAWAAAAVFRMDPAEGAARDFVDRYHPGSWSGVAADVMAFDTEASLTYLETPGATPTVVSAMRANLAAQVEEIFASDDLYRNGIPARSYWWGSNAQRAARGVLLLEAARFGITGSHTAEDCRRHALDILHFFHGQNPLSMVYLTNMASLGGEHSSWQLFHNWFGQSADAYSRSRFVGKAASIVEPAYPYFSGIDNHGVSDDKVSAFGPAPGFLTGGPNADYSGDASPPQGAVYPNRFYRDWNDQSSWTARTWEITENSIAYQGPYVALVAAFVSAASARDHPATSQRAVSSVASGKGMP